jgi:probable phosphoglycerate mutase
MSDVQCPSRVFLARHGEADNESALVTDHGGSLSRTGRAQARALGESLRHEGIARVWCSPLSRAVQTAEIAAATLAVDDVVVREDLREYGVGSLAGTDADEQAALEPVVRAWLAGDDAAAIPGGEAVSGVVTRVRGVLEDVADQHRGEAVLVVGHGGATMVTLPGLLGLPRSAAWDHVLPGGGHVALERDDDGWRLSPARPSR